MGANIVKEFKESLIVENYIIVTNEIRPIKSIRVAQERGVKLVHVDWVYDCENYM